MKIERTYYLESHTQPNPRVPVHICVTETRYCEEPECEARHDDPLAKWDQRLHRHFAEVDKLEDAELILRLLRAAEELRPMRLKNLMNRERFAVVCPACETTVGTADTQEEADALAKTAAHGDIDESKEPYVLDTQGVGDQKEGQ